MRRSRSSVLRATTLALLVAAVAVTAIVLFGTGGGAYTVEGRFATAGQIVRGNPVQSGGVKIGSVRRVGLAPNGQAALELSVDDAHSPPALPARLAPAAAPGARPRVHGDGRRGHWPRALVAAGSGRPLPPGPRELPSRVAIAAASNAVAAASQVPLLRYAVEEPLTRTLGTKKRRSRAAA